MRYLSGVTNDRDEAALVRAGVGLMIQPGNGYHHRAHRYPYYAVDSGAFNPATYRGDDFYLDYLEALPRECCLFAASPDVSRRADGSLGGDPVATWEKFMEFGPLIQEMGFPAALVAQDGIEHLDVDEQLDAVDCLFLGGSTTWKLGAQAEAVAGRARNLGKWVHMGRVNSFKRMKRARDMGCNSADGTFLKYRRQKRAGEEVAPEDRGAVELGVWVEWLEQHPQLFVFEGHSLPVHREAAS